MTVYQNIFSDRYTDRAISARHILSQDKIIVKGKDGFFLVPTMDFYIGRSLLKYGQYNGGEFKTILQLIRPGDAVVEVGANIGSHSVGIANSVGGSGSLLCFEPQKAISQFLAAQFALNQISNSIIHQCALGDESRTCYMQDIPVSAESSSGINFGACSVSGDRKTDYYSVPMKTLDEFELTRCDLIKIDVEGLEKAVILGAAETIKRARPKLYVENDRKLNCVELVDTILSFGYRIYWDFAFLYSRENFFEDVENIFGVTCSLNMICVPKELNITVAREEVLSGESALLNWPIGEDGGWVDIERAKRSSPNPLPG